MLKMPRQILLHIVLPMIVISLLMLGLGIVAAWNVQRQQVTSTDLIAREVRAMVAAQDLYVIMRDIRNLIQQYLRSGDNLYLNRILDLEEDAETHLHLAEALARSPDETGLIAAARGGYREFFTHFHQIIGESVSGDRKEQLGLLLDEILEKQVLRPASDYVQTNRQVVERTNAVSKETADQLRQAFLLLGICGATAGLVAGLGIARGIGRSIVQLNISVRGAADKLTEVVGPFTTSRRGDLQGLESGLRAVREHVTTVVERLQQRELEMLRQDQLAAVGQLAAGLAHELRNPLMPIKMLVQAALDTGEERGLNNRQLRVLEQEIHRMERLLQQFLSFAKPPKLEKSRVDLREILHQAIELVSARALLQQVRIESPELPLPVFCEADPQQMRQVLLNLLLNSLDAQPDGGTITLSLECAPASDDFPPAALIRVSDTGPGLSPEIVERVFEPFVSTKETGTGLGLPICQRIIEEHGGSLTLDDLPDGGTCFTIRLKLTSETGSETPEDAPLALPRY